MLHLSEEQARKAVTELRQLFGTVIMEAPEYVPSVEDGLAILARASSPAVAPAERCPSCGSREKAYRLCMIENCGEPHFEETAFSSTHMKAVCSDSWHTAAPAVAGRTQGDELAGFKEWAKSTGDYTSLVNGELVETWVVDDYPIWQAALKWAALRESAREAPEPTEKGT